MRSYHTTSVLYPYVVFERGVREFNLSNVFQSFYFFMFQLHHSNHKNITCIAYSYHKKITRKSTCKRRKLEHRYSNGNDYRYEAVKNEIRFRWGKKSITDKDKPLLKALAVAAPYFVDMDVADDSDAPPKPPLDTSPSRARSVVGAGVWIPDTSACMRCSRKFGCMYLSLTLFFPFKIPLTLFNNSHSNSTPLSKVWVLCM